MNGARSSTATLLVAVPPRSRPTPDPDPHLINVTVDVDVRLLLTVSDAARRLEISRSLFYELLAAGEIASIHVGRLRRIPAAALAEYVERRRACTQAASSGLRPA
jgi:excisionase family DNA binding protein